MYDNDRNMKYVKLQYEGQTSNSNPGQLVLANFSYCYHAPIYFYVFVCVIISLVGEEMKKGSSKEGNYARVACCGLIRIDLLTHIMVVEQIINKSIKMKEKFFPSNN